MDKILRKKPELLAPAGDMEKLRFAYIYGADAAYIGSKDFSLRAGAGNFSLSDIFDATQMAHNLNKKLYVAVNIFAHNSDIAVLPEYFSQLSQISPDALIVSDPGVFAMAKEYAPKIPIHVSTQANNINWRTAKFWADNGAERIVLGRDISLDESAEIADKGGIDTEIFVHGAICVSYSGRCLLSSYLASRSANLGDCAHPCRWKYYLMEEKRPGEYLPIEEDSRGTYIMNSKDLCLLDAIPQLCLANHSSWKIEGRNKSAYYVANTTRIYRAAIDSYYNRDNFIIDDNWHKELSAISYRDYSTAFAFGAPNNQDYRYDSGDSIRNYDFAAVVTDITDESLVLEQRNKLVIGDILEILMPDGSNIDIEISQMFDDKGIAICEAPHPRQKVVIPYSFTKKIAVPLIARRKCR